MILKKYKFDFHINLGTVSIILFIIIIKKKKSWLLRGSNPRPFGLVPKTSALDRSAKQPISFQNNFFY